MSEWHNIVLNFGIVNNLGGFKVSTNESKWEQLTEKLYFYCTNNDLNSYSFPQLFIKSFCKLKSFLTVWRKSLLTQKFNKDKTVENSYIYIYLYIYIYIWQYLGKIPLFKQVTLNSTAFLKWTQLLRLIFQFGKNISCIFIMDKRYCSA